MKKRTQPSLTQNSNSSNKSTYSLRRQPVLVQIDKNTLKSTNKKTNLKTQENNQTANNNKLKTQRCRNESLDKASVLPIKRKSRLLPTEQENKECKTLSQNNITSKPTRVLRKRKEINKLPIDDSVDSPLIRKKQKKINDPLAVYEFDYDPKDEPPQKHKRGRKYDSESSNDENNSMKGILKKLRTQDRKRNIAGKKQKNVKHEQKANDKTKVVETQPTEKSDVIFEQITSNNNLANTKSQEKEQINDHKKTVEDNSSDKANSEIFEVQTASTNNPEVQARSIVDEVTKSFIEDISDEENNCNRNENVSNAVISKDTNIQKNIFNSTTIDYESHPWRLNVSAIRKKTPYFSYKDKSFTPCYDPEIITPDFIKQADKKTNKENKETKVYQTSILNYVQSTPLKVNNSANIQKFVNPRKNPEASLFGLSFLSDEENKENISPVKSPKKFKKPTRSVLTDKQNIVQNKNEEKKQEKETESTIPAVCDISVPLFEDAEEDLQVSKKITRHYVRKHPKRKRLPSVESNYSDDELEKELPQKKKQKNVWTKEEEKEIDKLASHYNSMFEEIEKHHLIIE